MADDVNNNKGGREKGRNKRKNKGIAAPSSSRAQRKDV